MGTYKTYYECDLSQTVFQDKPAKILDNTIISILESKVMNKWGMRRYVHTIRIKNGKKYFHCTFSSSHDDYKKDFTGVKLINLFICLIDDYHLAKEYNFRTFDIMKEMLSWGNSDITENDIKQLISNSKGLMRVFSSEELKVLELRCDDYE